MAVAQWRPPGTQALLQSAESFGQSAAQAGHMAYFFVRAVAAVPLALRRFRREFLRILSDVVWGNGALVVGGGTIGVALVLGFTAGALVAIEGYSALNLLGLGPATGLISSLVTTRELAPIMVALAFSTQAGCRFTAQLGAMRIAEEIDALAVLGINPISYLTSTRIVASMLAVVPLFVASLGTSYLTAQIVVSLSSGQSSGTYEHYFGIFISVTDIIYATIKTVIFVMISSTIQCYYGFYASGGPQGVGIAAGRAMRASITAVVVMNMLLTMAMWGAETSGRFGG